MELSKELLESWDACDPGLAWFESQDETDGIAVVKKLVDDERLEWASWLIAYLLDRPDCIRYAVYAARSVLQPGDEQSQACIEAAERVIESDTEENRKAALAAARAAAWSAGAAARAAWAAARAAAWSAGAAARATWAAEWAAEWSAGAAARADGDLSKIVAYGLALIEGDGRCR